MPHDLDADHDHEELTDAQKLEIARYIWSQETVELKTIGIDIGSSTSHLLFAKVTLQRQTQGLSSRFHVIAREIVWRSPIMLTPFLPDGLIDAAALELFIKDAYAKAGFKRADIDSGAVILTGEAIKRPNARAIDELFAEEAGKFVCATAGHKLECTLAAHGSGAVRLSKERHAVVLHVDVGGGTTKMALIDKGKIVSVAAFAVGGRLIAEADGRWSRIDDSAVAAAKDLGISPDQETLGDAANRLRIAQRLAQIAANEITGASIDGLGQALRLTEPLERSVQPELITFSGGVSEYIFGTETAQYGDIAKPLATALSAELVQRKAAKIVDPGHRIRATVIGASQFTVQVSGKTIWLADHGHLPVHNVPVVHVGIGDGGDIAIGDIAREISAKVNRLDRSPLDVLAVAFTWVGDPEYARLRDVAKGILRAVAPKGRRDNLLLLMIDGDVGRSLGHVIEHELEGSGPANVVSIDGVQLDDFDYVDVGQMLTPPGVVPVVIKSLLFS
jgi:ethanolamine utilization protein EutA